MNADSVQQQFLRALDQEEPDRVRELIAAGANVNDPIGNPGGETPLIRAITTGKTDLVNLLMENGADVNLRWKGPTLWTPMMFAHDNPAILARLLAAGADVNARAADRCLDASPGGGRMRSGGETALHLAAAANHAGAVKLLVQGGADVEAMDQDGLGPLDYAIEQGNATAAAEALVAAGAQLTPDRLDKMHSAAHSAESDLRELLPLTESIARPCLNQAGRVPAPITAPQRPATRSEPDDLGQSELRCPFCHALLYSRMPKLCGQCGRQLPPELLSNEQQAKALREERGWASELANKFDAVSAQRRSDRGDASSRSLSTLQLLRQVSCAAEFAHRKRPGFILHVVSYYLCFLLPAFAFIRLGVVRPETGLGAAALLIAFFSCRAWHRVSPVCPNCKQNITICPADYCHVCGEGLHDKRCQVCNVDASWTSFLRPYGSAGNLRCIVFCPGCGVLLETRIPRWQLRQSFQKTF
jgi:hypothetical protein